LLRAIIQTRRNSHTFLVCTLVSWLRIVGNQEIFCEEYARAMNRLHAEHNAPRAADEDALNKAERDLARLVQALLDGVPAAAVREKMAELEARREALRSRLAASEDLGIRLHPNMAGYYRTQVADLCAALTEAGRHLQAAEIVRKLVDRIELRPVVRSGRKTLSVSLYGRLAGILAMATKAKAPLDESDAPMMVTKLVAGARPPDCGGTGRVDIRDQPLRRPRV
jgi:site-specific DNA recombinase